MANLLGYTVRYTDAIHDDHVKVEGSTLFCGRRTVSFVYGVRLGNADGEALLAAIKDSEHARRSVQVNPLAVEAPKQPWGKVGNRLLIRSWMDA